MNRNRKRIYSFLCMIIMILSCIPTAVFAQQTVYLKTPNDLLRLAKNCRDEGYSKEVQVVLENDIDMSETDFSPIPYFAGSFDGRGYAVRGVRIDFDGSEAGFFRRIAEGAQVSGLHLEVNLILEDTLSAVGGLVGENSGTVSNCVVTGTVKGGEQIGGIAGVNTENGRILSCTSEAEVNGEEQTGGIAGRNEGTISGCVNHGNINNRSKKSDSKGVGALSKLGFHTDEVRLSGRTLYNATGGISGQNEALIEGCTNYGKIGYAHVGDRSGGIAGVQGGKITDCANYGAVQGKRNVGGIAGQFVPDADITYAQSKAEHLSDELSSLSSLIRNYGDIVRDADLAQDAREIGDALDLIREHLRQSGTDADERTQDLLDVFEEQSDTLHAAVDGITEQLDKFSDSANRDIDGMVDAMEDIRDSLGAVEEIKDIIDEESEKSISPQLDAIDKYIRRAVLAVNDIASELREVEELLRDARRIINGNTALSEMVEELVKLFQSLPSNNINGYAAELPLAAAQMERDAARLKDSVAAARAALSAAPQERHLLLEILQTTAFADESQVDSLRLQTEEIERSVEQVQQALRSKSAAQAKTQVNRLLPSLMSQIDEATDIGAEEQVNLETQLQEIRALIQKIESGAVGGSSAQEMLARLKEAEKQISDLIQEYQKLIKELKQAADLIRQARKIINDHKDAGAVVRQLAELFKKFDGIQIAGYINRLSSAVGNINREFQDIRKGISNISDKTEEIASDSLDEIDAAADLLNEYAKDFNQSAKTLSDNLTENVRAFNNAAEIIGDETNDWASVTSDKARSTADYVNDRLDTVSRRLDRVTDSAERIGDRFSSNSDTVHDQLADIKDAAANLGEQPVRNIEENVTRDFSRRTGLILNCVNDGAILGDSGVGGIAGTVSLMTGEWDVDEDAEWSAENVLLDATVVLTCIVSDCKNTADITAKKEYVGGILGKGEHGTILNCLSTGDVTAEEGGLCGGIVGMSDSLIENSSAMGALSGSEYIGGIAGKCKDIRNCYTMVLIPDGGEKIGAITGETAGKLAENYFVREDLAGVDGVDYPDKAMPLEYEELVAIEAVPDEFRNLSITFLTDGEVVASYPIVYNQSFDRALIPKVSEREGGYSKWEDFDTDHILRSLKINLQYVPWTKTISSGGRKPVMLAEGAFTENARLETAAWEQENKPRGYRILEGYEFAVQDEDNPMAEHFSARVYTPYDGRVKVLVQKDDGWRETEYTTDGSYLVFPAENSGTFLLVRRSRTGLVVTLLILTLLIAGMVWYFIKKRRLPRFLPRSA